MKARRWLEGGMIAVVGVLSALLMRSFLHAAADGPAWAALAGVLAGYVAADFLSGLAHWAADNFGSPDTPWLGPTFIQPFRNHHADPEEITRHDFIEANGNTAIFISPLMAFVWWAIPPAPGDPATVFALGAFMVLWPALLMTNQFHKWAHMPEPPRWARPFQRLRLILSPAHHRRHHTAPFDTYYCITTGWLNVPLERLGIFSGTQRLIEAAFRRPGPPTAPPAG